jgi:hypothetical protein
MDGFSLMDDGSAARARLFREKAEEIRRAALLANSLDIVRESMRCVAKPNAYLRAGRELARRSRLPVARRELIGLPPSMSKGP